MVSRCTGLAAFISNTGVSYTKSSLWSGKVIAVRIEFTAVKGLDDNLPAQVAQNFQD